MNLEKLNLVELNAQEVQETEGGKRWYDLTQWYDYYLYLSNMSSGGDASTSAYTNGSYVYF